MENNRKVPNIRFAGFTDAWEQRKLGELLKEFSEKSKVEDEYTVLSSTNSGMEVRNGRVSGTSNLGYKIIQDEDLVLSPQNLWLGNININDIGTGLVSPSYKTFRFVKVNPEFIKPQLRMPRMLEEYKNASTQGASVVRRNLELDSFYQIQMRVPNGEEQNKIGKLFSNLDNLITLHQREYDLLVKTKKSYLQKMFPQNGENKPELRFTGFTDAWEQRKLGEIVIDIVAGGDIDKNKIKDLGKYPVIANALTNDGIVGYYEEDFRIKAPAVTVTGRGYVGHAKARNTNFTPVVRLLSITSNHDINFLENAINNINVVVESTGVPQLTVPQLEKYKIYIPNNQDEEKAIGTFFKNLDNLITLHQRELNSLKNMKKSLLQQMFV